MRKKAWTFRSKVLLTVVVTVVFTAITIQCSARRETKQAMFAAYDANAMNLVSTVTLHVESEYRSILFHKSAMLDRRKAELRNMVTLAVERIEKWHREQDKSGLPEAVARQRALDDVSQMRYDGGVGYFWINDTRKPKPRMIMHPTMPELVGSTMDEPRFNTAMGIDQNVLAAFAGIASEQRVGFVDYLAPKPTASGLTEYAPKISCVTLFEPWGWVVGSGVYVDDLEAETQRRVDAVRDDLNQTFARVRIAETGNLFIFNGRKELLVHPFMARNASTRNPETGIEMLGEFIRSVKTGRMPFEYTWNKPGHESRYRFRKRVYLAHFEPLDWYIGAAFYTDEMELPAIRLETRILLLSSAVLLVAVALAVLVSKGLTEPLRRLAAGAGRIEQQGMCSTEIPVSGPAETRELGIILRGMLSSVKRSETDLKTANSYIGSIIDSMPSVLVGVDATGKVTQWNTAAEQVTGLGKQAALGQTLAEILPSIVPEMERVIAAINSRQTLAPHRQARRQDGQIRYQEVTVYPLVAEGFQQAVIRLDDVTERVRMEERMVQSEKMLSLGGLAAGMAHEINNPLGGMLQTAGVLASRLSDDLPANARAAEEAGTSMTAIRAFMAARGVPRMLERIRQSGVRAGEIVSNMLDFARKHDTVFSPHNLAELLDKTIELAGSDFDLKKNYDFRQIQIVRRYEEGVPAVFCEPGRLQQVFLNLLRNGAEAMQEAGTERPQLVLRLVHERRENRVRIEIEDNGPGMDEATRKRVFEPFFTTKPADRGRGLGLSVSYFIITETHGGTMSVESAPGEGTRFIVQLPVEREQP